MNASKYRKLDFLKFHKICTETTSVKDKCDISVDEQKMEAWYEVTMMYPNVCKSVWNFSLYLVAQSLSCIHSSLECTLYSLS